MFATERVADVPLSAKERRVLADGVLVSLIVSVPLELLDPKVRIGEVAVKAMGEEAASETVPLAAMVVAPLIAPALVIPPALLLRPLLIDAPLVTVSPPFNVCNPLKVFV